MLEAAYVGTRGRDLVSRVNGNAVPEGALLPGTVGNADLVESGAPRALDDVGDQHVPAVPGVPGASTYYDFEGESNYNSLQVTLSRQTGRRLQYFATYTLGRTKGTLGDEYRNRDPFNPARTYGIRQEDRTHIFNLSWNAFLPDRRQGPMDNAFGRGLLNGWQLSGISTVASGTPIWLGFAGPAGSDDVAQAYYGTPDIVLLTEQRRRQRAASRRSTPATRGSDGSKVGEKMFDINCIGFPAFGEVGDVLPPYDLRTPTRHEPRPDAVQELRDPRATRSSSSASGSSTSSTRRSRRPPSTRSDIDLTLDTVCNRTVEQRAERRRRHRRTTSATRPAGSASRENTINNFGKINLLRGRRIIEFALKYYF